jgi:hypothetical protein
MVRVRFGVRVKVRANLARLGLRARGCRTLLIRARVGVRVRVRAWTRARVMVRVMARA